MHSEEKYCGYDSQVCVLRLTEAVEGLLPRDKWLFADAAQHLPDMVVWGPNENNINQGS